MEKIKKLINSEYKFSKYQMLLIIVAVFVFGGIFGFIYETIFYKIDLGYFVKRGSTFGPWIPIYGFGAAFIAVICNKFKSKPLIIVVLSSIICGTLEFLTGYLLYNINGIRLWDYNTEIWNFGNIGGYICLRSVLFFGISGLFLMYIVLPIAKKYCNKLNVKVFSLISLIPGVLFVTDMITYLLIK